MSRRGNCHDNAVAESFFQLLKRERIRKKTYATRQEARSDIFSYIEMFYNPIRRHSSANGLSPVEFERRNCMRLNTVKEILLDSQHNPGIRLLDGERNQTPHPATAYFLINTTSP